MGRTFIVSAGAVARVVMSLQRGEISGDAAQSWASFVRVGFLAGSTGPIKPIHIDYDADSEDAIVEVIARLDSIGDAIDGEVPTAQEFDELLALLAP